MNGPTGVTNSTRTNSKGKGRKQQVDVINLSGNLKGKGKKRELEGSSESSSALPVAKR